MALAHSTVLLLLIAQSKPRATMLWPVCVCLFSCCVLVECRDADRFVLLLSLCVFILLFYYY